jgi:hypothetical protein
MLANLPDLQQLVACEIDPVVRKVRRRPPPRWLNQSQTPDPKLPLPDPLLNPECCGGRLPMSIFWRLAPPIPALPSWGTGLSMPETPVKIVLTLFSSTRANQSWKGMGVETRGCLPLPGRFSDCIRIHFRCGLARTQIDVLYKNQNHFFISFPCGR